MNNFFVTLSLLLVFGLVNVPASSAQGLSSWSSSLIELPDFFEQFSSQFGEKLSEDEIDELLNCMIKTDQNAALLGDINPLSGALYSEKPSLDFWKWYINCLNSPKLVKQELLADILAGSGLEPNLITEPWKSISTEQRIVIATQVLNHFIPNEILIEYGYEPQKFVVDYLITPGSKESLQESNLESIMRLFTLAIMSTEVWFTY